VFGHDAFMALSDNLFEHRLAGSDDAVGEYDPASVQGKKQLGKNLPALSKRLAHAGLCDSTWGGWGQSCRHKAMKPLRCRPL
jgi:hypothetical protein